MIRTSLVLLFVLALSFRAFKDWFVSLCGLILMMAAIEHPDMPKTMFGIQGLNPWNFLLLFVLLGWANSRRRERRTFDLPPQVTVVLLLFLGVVLVGWGRMFLERHATELPKTTTLIAEYLVNTLKWVVPGLLLFDGCRSRERFTMATLAVLGVYLLLGLQVIKWMPLSSAVSGEALTERSARLLKEVGFHRSNLSMMLAGGAWAMFAARVLARNRVEAVLLAGGSLILAFAQSLTAGRTGYVTWLAVGFVLCLLRWRRYLLLMPVAAALILAVVPGAAERLTEGFSAETRDTSRAASEADPAFDEDPDSYTITSGRTLIWPFVIEKIEEAPLFGYGRLAMRRTGLSAFLMEQLGESFPHPHSAYLEQLLDNGALGFLIVLATFAVLLWHALSLFLDSRSPVFVAAGGVAAAVLIAFLLSSVGNHSFYPREGSVPMWCAVGLMLRVWVERERVNAVQRARRQRVRQAQLEAAMGNTAAPVLVGDFGAAAARTGSTDEMLWASV